MSVRSLRPVLFAAAFAPGLVAPLDADPIFWNPAATIAGDTDVSTAGNAVYAANGSGGSVTLNGVTFAGGTTTTTFGSGITLTGFTGTYTAYTGAAAPYTSLSSAYQSLIQGGSNGGATTATVTLGGLTSGHTYLTQFWVNDGRSLAATRTESVNGANSVSLDYNNTNATGGVGQYSTGIGYASTTSLNFTVTSASSVQINAVQVRDVTNLGAWNGASNASGVWSASSASFGTNTYDAALASDIAANATGALNAVVFGDNYWDAGTSHAVTQTSVTLSGTVALGSANLLFQNATANYTLDGTAGTLSTTGALVKSGAGTLTLSGAGAGYTGATYVGAGKLVLAANAALTTSGITLSGGTLAITSGATLGSGTITASSGTITAADANAVGFANNLTVSGSTTFGAASTGNLTLSGTTTLSASSTLTINNTLTEFSGKVGASNYAITKAGSGELRLSGTGDTIGNTSVNSILINAGTVSVTGGTVATSGSVKVGNATGTTTTAFNITGGTFTTDSTLYVADNATTTTGSFNLSGGSFSGTTLLVATRGKGTTNISGTANVSLTTIQYSHTGGADSTGVVNLDGGTLNLGSGGVTDPRAGSTTTFNFNGGLLKASAGFTSFVVDTVNVRNGGAIIDTNGFNVAISKTLSHSNVGGDAATDGGLTKNGAGTLTLSGTNTYTGATVVTAGTLVAAGASALGNGGAVNVTAGTLSVAAGVHVGTITGVTLASGATLSFADVTGALTLSGGSYNLASGSFLDVTAFATAGTYHLIAGASGSGTALSGFTNTTGGFSYQLNALSTGMDLVVTAVPEPATYGLLGAAALAGIAAVRRRRKIA